MSGADRDAVVVEDRPDIVGVDAVESERQDPGFSLRRSDDADSADRREGGGGIAEEFALVRDSPREVDALQVIHRCAEAHAAGYIGRAGFKLMRKIVVE